MKKKQIKVGVSQGGGAPPGYEWSVWILACAFNEARDLYTEAQYEHLALQVQELARHADPTHSDILSIDKIESFYELRDKGGVLGNINARVFYGVDKTERGLVVLGTIKKQNNGPTPLGDKVRMRRRWRKYQNGDYGVPG